MSTMQIWKGIIQEWRRYDPVTAEEETHAAVIVSNGNGHILTWNEHITLSLVARYPIRKGIVSLDGREQPATWSCKALESWWGVTVSIDLPTLEPGLHTLTIHPRFAPPLNYKIRG